MKTNRENKILTNRRINRRDDIEKTVNPIKIIMSLMLQWSSIRVEQNNITLLEKNRKRKEKTTTAYINSRSSEKETTTLHYLNVKEEKKEKKNISLFCAVLWAAAEKQQTETAKTTLSFDNGANSSK